MSGKLEKLRRAVNDNFPNKLKEAFADQFGGEEIETTLDICSLRLVTKPIDNKRFTKEQVQFIAGYETGYLAAKDQMWWT
jgi:hypothetical protein